MDLVKKRLMAKTISKPKKIRIIVDFEALELTSALKIKFDLIFNEIVDKLIKIL